MKRTLSAAALLLLASACADPSPQGDEASQNQELVTSVGPGKYAPEHVPGGIAITEVGSLLGEYRVAGINDAELSGRAGIALSIDGPMISFEPTCAGFVWQAGFEDGALRTRRAGNPADRAPNTPPPPVCAVSVSADQLALATALDAATRAERMPSNAVRLSGGGHSVTLFGQ